MNFVFDRRVLLLRQEHNIFLLPNYHCRCPCYRQFYCLSLFALKCSITDLIGRISYATLTMFGSSLSLGFYRGLMSQKCYLCLFAHSVDKHVLTIRVTLRMYYKRHERLLFASALVHPRFVVGYALLIFLYFCIVLCFCVLFVFVLYLVCPMLPRVSGLSIVDRSVMNRTS